MPKQTLLDMTQDILSAIDGDEVNSISDTVEAMQVVAIIKRCYLDIVTEHELPCNEGLTKLIGLGDVDKPNVMQIPESVSKVNWIQYDCREDVDGDKEYRDMKYLAPLDFMHLVNSRSSTDTDNNVVVEIETDVPLVIDKTKAPTYWTSFDDEYIVFDSYNSDVDSTLQQSKSIIHAGSEPTFTIDDDFIPDLPENLFSYLYNKAEANAFAKLKQETNIKTEQSENRHRIRAQRNKWRQGRAIIEGPDYGRK
jgi:hypothetical protein